MKADDEDDRLRSAALQNAESILRARQRAEQELLQTQAALEDERRILERLNQTGAALASRLDLEGVVQAVVDAGTEFCGARFGAFLYTLSGSGTGRMQYTLTGASREALERLGNPRHNPLFAPTFRGEGVIRLGDVRKDARFQEIDLDLIVAQGPLPVCSYLAVPVVSRSGEVIGGLFFGHPDCDTFSERAERLVLGLAAQAAIAIDNARLYEDARRSADERARLLEVERLARAEIERVSRIKDEFLATLSHELRTPLNAVLGWSEILLGRGFEDADLRRGLESISRNARAQARLIDDLLDMNRIVSGKVRLDVQRLELAAVIEGALDSVLPSANAKSLTVHRLLDPDVGPVYGDPNRLQQVVWNLLSNAVKFTPRGGRIEVQTRRVSSHIEIRVQDSGSGIAADFLPHVFDRFRQADASLTRKHGGLGLGLSIVKQLVELHGGSVQAVSGGERTGATFIVSLPLRAVHDAPEPVREHPSAERGQVAALEPVSLTAIRVLLIDDEPDARDLLRAVLSEASAEAIHTAASAEEGLALLAAHRPHVIVSDIGMPEQDGYQFIRAVRSLAPGEGGQIPAIALTAFARSEDRTRALLAGYQVHLAKPVEPRELVAAIASLARNQPGTTARPPDAL